MNVVEIRDMESKFEDINS